jgi:glyoxylase-like metal-dependent hydrolase (beta-lactamase superfamily II)
MLERRPVFPNVIEINHQLQRVLGCNVYLVYDENEWVLIDTGYDEVVDELLELIRQLDFPFANCKMLIATHADVDHIQGLAKAKEMLRTEVAAHPRAAKLLSSGEKLQTFAEIEAQDVHLDMPPVEVERLIDEGDRLQVGSRELEVWFTPGHTNSQLSFRFGDLLFCGDNIFRDGCVGAIDAHHGSDLPGFVSSLERIRNSDVQWLLPSHGPIFRKENALLDATIERIRGYQHMADFGTCALDWPLLDQWEQEMGDGCHPFPNEDLKEAKTQD